jgi:hypothetical protein
LRDERERAPKALSSPGGRRPGRRGVTAYEIFPDEDAGAMKTALDDAGRHSELLTDLGNR